MGLAPAIPSIEERRRWEWIDDRQIPEGSPDGEFRSFTEWLNKASSWIGFTGAKCYDAKGRRCRSGGEMERANEEKAFPVSWYFPCRYPEPKVLTPKEIKTISVILLAAENNEEPMSLETLREAVPYRNLSQKKLHAILGEDSFEATGEIKLNGHGMEEAREYINRARRASYVR